MVRIVLAVNVYCAMLMCRSVELYVESSVQFHAPTVVHLAKPPLLHRAAIRPPFPGHALFFSPNILFRAGFVNL